jgi:hypothetical protein
MRTLILVIILIASIAIKAQTSLPIGSIDYMQREPFGNNTHSILKSQNKKWFLSSYSGISTSFVFFNGGNATVFAVPLGLQLNRRLNNNFYAFAGISAAPAYINFNQTFLSSPVNKTNQINGLFKSNRFDLYSKAELGLMYVNDARTFSVSGSIGVQRSNYPFFPYQRFSNAKQNRGDQIIR